MALLAQHELNSSTWVKLKEHITSTIDALRKKNDGQWTDVETAAIRGQILALKNLLLQAEPPPVVATAEYDAD